MALKGSECRQALEQLDEFLSTSRDKTITELLTVDNKDEAWDKVLYLRAMMRFVKTMEGSIAIGNQANKELANN
jgi:hypothetical protein